MLSGTSPWHFPDDQWSWASFPVFVNKLCNFPGETSIQALGPFLNWIVCLLVIFKQGTPILVSKHTASSRWDAKQDVNSIVSKNWIRYSEVGNQAYFQTGQYFLELKKIISGG